MCKPPWAQLGMGPAQRDSGPRCPLLLRATRWGWGRRFREHWTTAGPLPRPAGQEFALPNNSTEFGAKLILKLPLFPLLSGLCLGLACLRGAKLLSCSVCWPITPAMCPWVLLGAEQGLGGLSGPACLPSTFLGYRLGSTWQSAEHQAGSDPVAFSERAGLQPHCKPPAALCQGDRLAVGSTSRAVLGVCPHALGHSVRPCAKASPALAPPCPEALGKVPPQKQSPGCQAQGSHGQALRGEGSWALGKTGHGLPFPLSVGLASVPGAVGSTAGPCRGSRPAAAGVRRGGDRGR